MAYQMVEAHNSALEFITLEIQDFPKNQGLNKKGSQLNQNFYLENKDGLEKKKDKIKKQKKVKIPYSATKVKARTNLSNISYRDVSKSKIWIILHLLSMYTHF